MKQALGLVEIQGLATAIAAADAMTKAANIRILEIENAKGLGYMTIKAVGGVGAVNAAVNAGRQTGIMNGKLISWKVIPRPSDHVEHMFCDPMPPGPGSFSGEEKKAPAKEEPVESESGVKPEPGMESEAEAGEPPSEAGMPAEPAAVIENRTAAAARSDTAQEESTNRKNKGDANDIQC